QWYARCDDTDRPDYLHFDLDPVKGATFVQVREAALIVRETLDSLKMPSYPKTTGSRGIHVYVPIVRGPTQKDVWSIAKTISVSLAGAPSSKLQALRARLLAARGSDRGLHFLLFLGRREHRRHPERLDPQLAAPAGRVVEVLVLLVFHLVVGGHQRLLELALRLLGDLVDQLPVQVVLRLGFHHALARHELRGVRRRVLVRHFHGFDQRLADVA